MGDVQHTQTRFSWVVCLGALGCSAGTSSGSPQLDSGQSHEGAAEPDTEDPDCLTGSYVGTLEHLSGTCGAVDESFMVTLTQRGVLTPTEMRLGSNVITMVVVRDCMMRLQREVVTTEGVLSEKLNANELELVSPGTIAGEAELTRFENNAQSCSSTYQLTLQRI